MIPPFSFFTDTFSHFSHHIVTYRIYFAGPLLIRDAFAFAAMRHTAAMLPPVTLLLAMQVFHSLK
jgi:hypothetical protein